MVEIDGDTHEETEAEDAARTLWLETQGYRVVTFTNDDVMQGLDAVLEGIVEAATGLRGREDDEV